MPSSMNPESGEAPKTRLDKEIEDKFSQPWQLYRIAMHDKGGLDIAADMSWKYSTKQLYDFLEMLDVYDSLKKQAVDREKKPPR